MGIYTALPQGLEEVDVIVAGGGTAGCVVASRLADADPKLSILVIESGKDNYQVPTVTHPVLWMGNYMPGNPNVFNHVAVKEEQLANREYRGGSSVNLMMYTRAQGCDYDSWNTEGWKTDDMVPYLKKFETYHGLPDKENHGYDGPVHVSGGSFRSMRAEDDFVDATRKVGFAEVEDLQDLESTSVSRGRKFVSPEGIRQDAAHAYLHPKLQDGKHPHLHVLVESQVQKVLFDGGRASAVECRSNPVTQSNPVPGTTTVKARKLVVLSCGTLGSPTILERSGVGPIDTLKKAGITASPIVDLPGVGNDFQDHNMVICVYKADLTPEETPDKINTGQADIPAYLASRNKILGWNGIDAWTKVRPTPSEVDALGPAFKEAWEKDFKDTRKPLISTIFAVGLLGDRSEAPPGQYFSMASFTTYPYSRGYVHITGPGIDDPLEFKTGYLTDKHGLDLKAQVWAYKLQRETVRRMEINLGVLPYRNPVFPPGSNASYAVDAVGDDGKSRPTKNIEYSPEDDAIIEDWLRKTLTTSWHGIGTCKMAPRDQLGVVDNSLGVYGVTGLKIADLSIVPENVCANTMTTALAIGEKAADIFIRELDLA
ncbi:putative alcohol oxidase [Hypoxylon sp. FL1284]|nr:putative alcohol oxidase [Hypoxylon sp. FL1284]